MRRHIPNFITLSALCCGLAAITFAHHGQVLYAVCAVFLAAVLDLADGIIARLLNADSALGAELDSLADVINFGLCPAFILYVMELHRIGGFGWAIFAAYVVATSLRLARFNLKSQSSVGGQGVQAFDGVPSPLAATMVLALYFLAKTVVQADDMPLVAAALLVVASAGMLSSYKVPKAETLWRQVFNSRV